MGRCISCGKEIPEGYGMVCYECDSGPVLRIGMKVYVPECYNGYWFVDDGGCIVEQFIIDADRTIVMLRDSKGNQIREWRNLCFTNLENCKMYVKNQNGG